MENRARVEEMVKHLEGAMQRQVVTVAPDTTGRELLGVLAANGTAFDRWKAFVEDESTGTGGE